MATESTYWYYLFEALRSRIFWRIFLGLHVAGAISHVIASMGVAKPTVAIMCLKIRIVTILGLANFDRAWGRNVGMRRIMVCSTSNKACKNVETTMTRR